MDSARLYTLVAQLDSDDQMERLDAVYKLGSGRDKRALPHLINVLGNHEESPEVRGQAAESLTLLRTQKRKAIKALVDSSADTSAEVRFWCVFGLGHFVRKRKTPLVVVRALEDRLGDTESPDDRLNWWPVGLEALAMLRRYKKARFPIEEMFKETILKVMRDPLKHREHWRWADFYWDDALAGSRSEGRILYEAALLRIREAGLEPVNFGQSSS
jgi:HEAT repeat protein